jgi:hypothetical protein
MIECMHQWPLQILNRGLSTIYCTKLKISVNNDICSNCEFCEGERPKQIAEKMDFPSRSKEEIQCIYNVCKRCPLHNALKICDKMPNELHPTDVVAQHPSNHCPEGHW